MGTGPVGTAANSEKLTAWTIYLTDGGDAGRLSIIEILGTFNREISGATHHCRLESKWRLEHKLENSRGVLFMRREVSEAVV